MDVFTSLVSVLLSSVIFGDVVCQDKGCRPTSSDILGPYYYPNAPKRQQICDKDPYYTQWDHLLVEGQVFDEDCKTPLRDTKIEVWQADHDGYYLFKRNCRGYTTTAPNGFYAFMTIHPGKYAIDRKRTMFRPAHIHFKVESPGHKTLVTQLYFKGDSNLGVNDSCSRCSSGKPDLVVEPVTTCRHGGTTFCMKAATFNIVLQRGDGFSVKMDTDDKAVEVFDAVQAG